LCRTSKKPSQPSPEDSRDERENRHADIFPHTEPDPRDAKFPQLEEINPKINKKKEKQRRGWAVAHSALPSLHDTGGKKMWNTRKPKTVKKSPKYFQNQLLIPVHPGTSSLQVEIPRDTKTTKEVFACPPAPKKDICPCKPPENSRTPKVAKASRPHSAAC